MNENRSWTDKELEFVIRHFGRVSLSNIAKKIDRTECAIVQKMHRIGLGQINAQCKYTKRHLGVLLKTSYYMINLWVQHGLKTSKVASSNSKPIYQISVDNLLDFFRERPEAYDYYNAPEEAKFHLELTTLPDPPLYKRMECNGSHHIVRINYKDNIVFKKNTFRFWTYIYNKTVRCPVCKNNLGMFSNGTYTNKITYKEKILMGNA